MQLCLVSGDCGRKVLARNMCSGHYHRWRTGKPVETPPLRSLIRHDVDLATRLRAYAPERGPDECWEWSMCLNKGYGMISVGKSKLRGAHIVAWEIANNSQLPPGLVVRHKCDNPPCTNPRHLELGTHGDNVNDRVEHGSTNRAAPGWRHRTTDEVDEMRRLFTDGVNMAEIARRYGCSRGTAMNICKGKTMESGTRGRSFRAKLSDDQVRTIRRLYAEGDVSQTELGKQFGVDQTVVSSVVRRKIYSDVD